MSWSATAWNINAIDRSTRLKRLRRLAWFIDGAFRLPGTRFRFGLNSVVGLVPVGGDLILAAISLYIVFEASKLGIPKRQLGKMLVNVAIEAAAGSVPILGDGFDMVFKANLRNLSMIEHHVGGWR